MGQPMLANLVKKEFDVVASSRRHSTPR